jgi:chromate reductase
MSDLLQLVTVSGSLRAASFNSALLRALPKLSPPTVSYRRLDWSALPVLNEDDDPPALVAELQQAIRAADGLVIATPEYNKGIPGGLKNLIDWLSTGGRPHGLDGVPVALVGVSSGVVGTSMSQAAMRITLAGLNAPTMPAPQVLIGPASQRFDAEGELSHEPTREFVKSWVVAMERWMRRFPRTDR